MILTGIISTMYFKPSAADWERHLHLILAGLRPLLVLHAYKGHTSPVTAPIEMGHPAGVRSVAAFRATARYPVSVSARCRSGAGAKHRSLGSVAHLVRSCRPSRCRRRQARAIVVTKRSCLHGGRDRWRGELVVRRRDRHDRGADRHESSASPCTTQALRGSAWVKGAPSASARASTSSAEAPERRPA